MKLKHRRAIFCLLLALLSAGSMAFYSGSEANFWIKTIGLAYIQQMAIILIYLSCFGTTLVRFR